MCLGSLRSVILVLHLPLIFPIEDLLSNYGIVLRPLVFFLLNEEVALVRVHPLDVLLVLHGLHGIPRGPVLDLFSVEELITFLFLRYLQLKVFLYLRVGFSLLLPSHVLLLVHRHQIRNHIVMTADVLIGDYVILLLEAFNSLLLNLLLGGARLHFLILRPEPLARGHVR